MSPPPCLYDTVIQSYVQLKSGSIERTAHFMGRPTPLKVKGANFSTLLPPRGATFTPILRYGLTEPASLFKCGQFHIPVKSTLWATRHQIFFAMLSQWGNFGTLLPPQGCKLLPHFEVWSYRACQPLQMWQISNFCEIHSLSYEASKFFAHVVSQCVWFCPYFAPGANIVPPIAYKSHSTRFPIRPPFWHLIHGSVTKTVGGSSAPK